MLFITDLEFIYRNLEGHKKEYKMVKKREEKVAWMTRTIP